MSTRLGGAIRSTIDKLTPESRRQFEFDLQKEYIGHRDDTKFDLEYRTNGITNKRGGSGFQFAGYTTLEQFYRGDQWDHDEPPGAAQRTDNYCAVIIDNLSSLVFDDTPEINCPTDDPSDDLLELRAEMKEQLIWRVWKENDFEVTFDSWSKQSSLYGDGFIKGPWAEKEDGKWVFKFTHIENPAAIRPIFADAAYKKLLGFIDSNRISFAKAMTIYGDRARERGITLVPTMTRKLKITGLRSTTSLPMVDVDEYWTDEIFAVFINDKLLDYKRHNYGFVPLLHMKNIYTPNHPYGKSDIEDTLDPQVAHNRTNNDLANLLKWVSSINLWGKNLEGMQALVAGLSRIYSLPDEGELHAFERTGDPYISNTYVQQRRSAVIELSGLSESLLSSSQVSNASGRALALAFQGTIRKLNPRVKRYRSLMQQLNRNILKLYEIYYPETEVIIQGDYRNEVFLPVTLLRNIIDTINKFQTGLISHDTAMREAGVQQPRMEMKLMRKTLQDPIIGPQVARQPSLLPRLTEDQNQQGDQPNPQPGNQPSSSAEGAANAQNQQAGGAAPTVIP